MRGVDAQEVRRRRKAAYTTGSATATVAEPRGLHRRARRTALLRALPDEQFGVPLHADEEGRARIFHGLHDSALVAGNDLETAPEPVHRLVMERVHPAGSHCMMSSRRLPW